MQARHRDGRKATCIPTPTKFPYFANGVQRLHKRRNTRILSKVQRARDDLFREDPVGDFIRYLPRISKMCFNSIVCIAHNAKGYDNHFILKAILDITDWKPEILANSAKLLCITNSNLRFIDSLNILPMALTKLPSAFDLPQNLNKGYFQHFF